MKTNDTKSHRDYIATHLKGVPRSGIRDFFDIVSSRKDIISLGIGEPDFATPWGIREASIYALDRGATSYTSNLGLESLRSAISDYISDKFGVRYDPASEILVTVGVSEALDLAVRAIVNPGDEVIYHEPSYVCYAPIVTFAHGKSVAVQTRPEDGFVLERDMIEKKLTDRTKALLINFPTNPTGATLNRGQLEGIAKLACERDLLVVTDEIYSELTYEGERMSIASMPGMKDRTLLLHGLSKAWAMTGFRLGYACGRRDLIEAMMKIHQYTMMCAPILSQKAGIEALRNHDADVERMRRAYEKRRNYIVSSLNEMGLSCHMPKGAFYAFPDIRSCGLSSKDFALRLLDEENVACVPGTAFGSSGEGFLRCSYATDIEEIKEAMKRMAAFVERGARNAERGPTPFS